MDHFPIPDYAKDNPDENRGSLILTSAIVMACLSTSAVVLRFLSRFLTRVPRLADDWLILAALPFALMICAIDIYGALHLNFGRHLQYSTPESLRKFFQATFTFEIAYNFSIVLPKFSILALYWRVFGLASIKWPLTVVSVITLMFLLGCTASATFACNPPSDYWNNPGGTNCIDHFKYYSGQAIANIVIDIILMLLPIIPIRRLHMKLSQKIAVCGIFFLGIFVTICSGLRLERLLDTEPVSRIDPTFTLIYAAVWSVIESNLAIVCVCLPSMRPLLKLLLHGKFGSSTGGSRQYPSHYDSVAAANSKRRSQKAPSMALSIKKEQHTAVSAASAANRFGSDIELGYFATVTATHGDVGPVDWSRSNHDTRLQYSRRSSSSRERCRDSAVLPSHQYSSWMQVESEEDIVDQRQPREPAEWPLELSKSELKDLEK